MTRRREEIGKVPACPIQVTDLTKISRNAHRARTHVILDWSSSLRVTWLVFGECSLRTHEHRNGKWSLEARFAAGVTDFEHDSIFALRLPLVGVDFRWADGHSFQFDGFVDASLDPDDNYNGFHVPSEGYDPRKHPETYKCNDNACDSAHLIVPEGFYVPKYDPVLYKLVAGKRISIHAGLTPTKST